MKHLIPILLIVFISCGNAAEYKEVDKEICFEVFKKGKVVDKQIKDIRTKSPNGSRHILIDMIYKKKYYTLRINKLASRISTGKFLYTPSSFECSVYE
jgi:hypothetical protein